MSLLNSKMLSLRMLTNAGRYNFQRSLVFQYADHNNFTRLTVNTVIKLYSSSSSSSSSSSTKTSSSSSSKKSNTTPTSQKRELPFVPVKHIHIHPRELAQSTFFAEHRPLLNFGSEQTQQSEKTKQTSEEEDYEEENPGLSANGTMPNNNQLSHFLNLFPLHQIHQTIPNDIIANRFLSDIELKIKQEQLKETEINSIKKQQGQLVIIKAGRRKIERIHLSNIMQKRRLKMKKHKLKKLRKRTRALRKRLGKI